MTRLKWVVVGIGDITTKRVIPAIAAEPRSELHGVVSRDPTKARRYAERAWTSLDAALADSAVDAVYVATPVALHAPQTIAAIRAGKHVLCEKPMAMNHAEAQSMADEAERTGRVLGVAYYRRQYPKVRRAMELLAAGTIGQPVVAEISAWDWFNDEDGRRSWLLNPAMAGGGPLYDTASHRIDLLNFMFGRPLRVTAQLSTVVHHVPVEDAATVLIEYEAGVRGIVDVRRHCRVGRDEFRIGGTEGSLDLSPLNGPELVWPGGRECLPPHSNLHYPAVENFVAAVLDGAPLAATGATSLWTDWVTEQAVRAATAQNR